MTCTSSDTRWALQRLGRTASGHTLGTLTTKRDSGPVLIPGANGAELTGLEPVSFGESSQVSGAFGHDVAHGKDFFRDNAAPARIALARPRWFSCRGPLRRDPGYPRDVASGHPYPLYRARMFDS